MLIQQEDKYHCVGCGTPIGWDGKSLLAYTCHCRGTIFASSEGKIAPPASLLLSIATGKELPHIDYYLGISNYNSTEKEAIYKILSEKGAVWSWDCTDEKCRKRFLERVKMEVQEGFIRFELHPALKAAIDKQ